jgi:hypothetical protein
LDALDRAAFLVCREISPFRGKYGETAPGCHYHQRAPPRLPFSPLLSPECAIQRIAIELAMRACVEPSVHKLSWRFR